MLNVAVLGELTITGGNPRQCSSRAFALIAFLAARAGSPQPRQLIAGLFWPESTDGQALTNLRRELHNLRQALGDEPALVVTSRDLCWRDSPTCRVDLRIFSLERQAALAASSAADRGGVLVHAASALVQYRGDLLPGMYDDWLLETRAELERQCADLCDLLSQARAEQGDLSGAVEAARRRIQLQPLEETGYRTLMRLQADLGDRAGAVSTYHHCASVLERELGVSPDPATQLAFQRLIHQASPGDQARTSARPGPGRTGLAAAQLVGRTAELSRLQELWQAAAAGQPGLAVVRGGAGVGKTRLVAEVAGQARRQGAVVAGSQCFGTSGRLALAPVADWLRTPAVQSATAALDEPWRAEVGRLMPTGSRGGPRPGALAMAAAWQRHRFFEGLARALLGVDRPTLLVLDNLQWCDEETLAFLTFCLRLDSGARLLVAATARDDDPGESQGLGEWAGRMRSIGLLTELSLGPFEAADTARLAEAISGRPLPPADASLLQATTGGFPLYVIEALRGAAGPDEPARPAGDIRAVLRNRLEQVSAAAREVAGLAAAVGTDFSLDLLTEASDLDADGVVQAVDELWRRRIMREFGDGYDFTHELLREAAYLQVSPPKRWLLHRRVAQGLELMHSGDPDAVAAQLAQQYARGGRPDRAVAYYRRAADVATGVFAHAEAIRLHQEALSVVASLPAGRDRDRQELAIRQALAAPLNARYGYASAQLQQTLERSVALAQSLDHKDATLNGMVALWSSRFVQGRMADCYQIANQALSLAEAGSKVSGPAHFAVGGSAFTLGMAAAGLRHLELAAGLAEGALMVVGNRSDLHARVWAAHAHWLLGHDDEALANCAAAISAARALDHPYNLTVTLAYLAVTHQLGRDTVRLKETLTELRELCERYDFAYYREWALILDGWSHPDKPGIERARRGISQLKAAGAFARMPYWLSLLADMLARTDQPAAARATLDAALAAGQAHDDLWWLPEVMRMRAAYDGEQAAITRLRSAAEMASAHGSLALLRRCQDDLAQRGVPLPAPGVRPLA